MVISESGASIENLENMSNYIANKINLYNISNKSILFSWENVTGRHCRCHIQRQDIGKLVNR